jgi:hypothetical protein
MMRKLAVLLSVMLLVAWGSVTIAVDMNRVEGARIWNCMQKYQKMEMDKATRDKFQPGQIGDIYQTIPGDIRSACELAPPAGG